MFIPHTSLQPEVLDAMIEEFVTRDGAVHGHSDVPLDSLIRSVHQQLQRGLLEIHFDEADESWTILPKNR